MTGSEISWSRKGLIPGWNIVSKDGKFSPEFYDNLYRIWQPEHFDAREWVQLAVDAGAKYIIFLTKHHDGYCLFDTALTDYKQTSAEAAWQKDVVADISQACHDLGIGFVAYYSQPDWYHPDFMKENHLRNYVPYLHGQVRELLTKYGPVEALWFDGWGFKPEEFGAVELFKMIRTLQPGILINDRCILPGDWKTAEQGIMPLYMDEPWESCVTVGRQWGWRPDEVVKSLKECIDILVTTVGRDGNLALNVGPRPDGRIEPEQARRFREIGRWLNQFGETIYGTRGGPFESRSWGTEIMSLWGGAPGAEAAWGVSTRKGNTIYLHLLHWPEDVVELPPMAARIVGHSVLTGGTATVTQTDRLITVSVPAADRHELDTIVQLELDRPALDVTLGSLPPSGSLASGKPAQASNVHNGAAHEYYRAHYGAANAFDDRPETRWSCDWTTHAAWLEVDLEQPTTFRRAVIDEICDRIKEFELQAKRGEDWETFYHGITIGTDHEVRFEPVTARHVRLNILKSVEAPSIVEFQLFE